MLSPQHVESKPLGRHKLRAGALEGRATDFHLVSEPLGRGPEGQVRGREEEAEAEPRPQARPAGGLWPWEELLLPR